MDDALSQGTGRPREMITVMPNAYGAGSFYSTSATTGDWEAFIAGDLVSVCRQALPDDTRTRQPRRGRSLQRPVRCDSNRHQALKDLFEHLHSEPMLSIEDDSCGWRCRSSERGSVRSAADLAHADFVTKALIALAASWSPNPDEPPSFSIFLSKDVRVQPIIAAKWTANLGLAVIDHHTSNIHDLHAIAIDVGAQDTHPRADDAIVDEAKALADSYCEWRSAHVRDLRW
jgi:hypothetical protein